MTSESFTDIDDIKKRYPIQEIVVRYTNVKRSGERLVGRCPFHDDRTPSFSVYLPTETWQCFAASCGLRGDVIDLVGCAIYGQAWNSRDKEMFKEALRRLTGGDLPQRRQVVPRDWREPVAWRRIELSPRVQIVLHTAARVYHTTLLAMGRGPGTPYAYLRERGFADDTIRQEALGYAAGDLLGPALAANSLTRADAAEINLLDPERQHREFLVGRIVFVERDRPGRVLHLIGRAFAPWLHADTPKYLSLKEMTKPLYGYARLDKRESDYPVVFVESPPDAITARQWGFDALANIGTMMKIEHAVLLSWLRRPLVYVPHNDGGPGLAAASRWKELIGHGQVAELPDDVKDLNELGIREGGEAEFVCLMKALGFERKPKAGSDESKVRHGNTEGMLTGKSRMGEPLYA
jgi:DNA primase